jgi:3-hydroxyacyl-CoA dehydrogenase
MTMARERIAVIGAGLMGHGIAQVFAVAGHDVAVHDAQATISTCRADRRSASPALPMSPNASPMPRS